MIFDKYVFGVLNLLKCIDRGNIPHYFDTYLNEKFIDFSKLSDCDDVLSMNTNSVDCEQLFYYKLTKFLTLENFVKK